jgi:CrcB protein
MTLRLELSELALVALGAVPGALLRWQAGVQLRPILPLHSGGADLLVNLIGSLLLGWLVAPPGAPSGCVLALGIGFCGSLTTFSSWMFDLARLQHIGAGGQSLLLLLSSLVLGLAAAALGYRLRGAHTLGS